MENKCVSRALSSVGVANELPEHVVDGFVKTLNVEKSKLQMLMPALDGYESLQKFFLMKIAQCELAIFKYEATASIH